MYVYMHVCVYACMCIWLYVFIFVARQFYQNLELKKFYDCKYENIQTQPQARMAKRFSDKEI